MIKDDCLISFGVGAFMYTDSKAKKTLREELECFDHSAMIDLHSKFHLPQSRHQKKVKATEKEKSQVPEVTTINTTLSIETLAQCHNWTETWTEETQLEDTMVDNCSMLPSEQSQALCLETLLDLESIQGLQSTQTSDNTIPVANQPESITEQPAEHLSATHEASISMQPAKDHSVTHHPAEYLSLTLQTSITEQPALSVAHQATIAAHPAATQQGIFKHRSSMEQNPTIIILQRKNSRRTRLPVLCSVKMKLHTC